MAYAPWNAYDSHNATVYALWDQPDGTVFDANAEAMVAAASATMAHRAVVLTEDANNSGVFPVVIPTGLPVRTEPYKVTVYHQNGTTPVGGSADDVIATFEGVWTGATVYDRQVTPGTTVIERTVVVQQA